MVSLRVQSSGTSRNASVDCIFWDKCNKIPHAPLRMWSCSIQRWGLCSFPYILEVGGLWIPEVTLCDFPSQVIKAIYLLPGPLGIFILGTKLRSCEEEGSLHGRGHIGTPADSPGWDSYWQAVSFTRHVICWYSCRSFWCFFQKETKWMKG